MGNSGPSFAQIRVGAIGFVILLQMILGLVPSFSEARSRPRQFHSREDKDILAMRDVNTNFLYTLVCDNSVSLDTRLARYQCLLNGMTTIDRSAMYKCVDRFDLRSNAEFINAFCKGRLGCRRFRYCIARERETFLEIMGTTTDPISKPTESALITAEPTSIAISTTTLSPSTASTTPTPTSPQATASINTEVTTQPTSISDTSMSEMNATLPPTDGETGRGDDSPAPSSPATSQPLQPDHPIETIDDEDDYFPCLCAKKAKYLKRSSKSSRQGRSLGYTDEEQFKRQQRQLEPAKLIFPLKVVRKCLIDFGDQPQMQLQNGSIGSTSSLRRYYAKIFRPF